jgi:hypothetical protein
MRKLFALLFVASLFTFASCEEKHEEAANEAGTEEMAPEAPEAGEETTTAPEETAAPDSVATDSAVEGDSTQMAE